MSPSCEAAGLIRRCVEPATPGESVKSLIWRAARRTGLSAARVKSIWYREATAILASEMDRLRTLAAAKREAEDAARVEYRELRERLDRIESFMATIAANMGGAPDDGGSARAGDRRGADRPLD